MSNTKRISRVQRRAPQHRVNKGRHRAPAPAFDDLSVMPATTGTKIAVAGVVGTSAALAAPAVAFAASAGGPAGPPPAIVQQIAPRPASSGISVLGVEGPSTSGKWPASPPPSVIHLNSPGSSAPSVSNPGIFAPGADGPSTSNKVPDPSTGPPGVVVQAPAGMSMYWCPTEVCGMVGAVPPDQNGNSALQFGVGGTTTPGQWGLSPIASIPSNVSINAQVTAGGGGYNVGASIGTDGKQAIYSTPFGSGAYDPATGQWTFVANPAGFYSNPLSPTTAPNITGMVVVTVPQHDATIPGAQNVAQSMQGNGTLPSSPDQIALTPGMMQQLTKTLGPGWVFNQAGQPADSPGSNQATGKPADGSSTAPTNGTAPGDGTAPATPPTNGTAPADTTAPGDGAAPTSPPTNGTTPADGTAPADTTAPGDGAAPTSPPTNGTTPADGTAPADTTPAFTSTPAGTANDPGSSLTPAGSSTTPALASASTSAVSTPASSSSSQASPISTAANSSSAPASSSA
jgi:hypothetical protein